MLETALYAKLRPRLTKWGTISRVENVLESGMWDIHYCFEGQLGWIETKVEKQGWTYFEKFQPNWGRRYFKAGATNLFIIIERDSGEVMTYHVKELLESTREPYRKWVRVRTKDLVPCHVLNDNWEELRLLLSSPFT